MINAVAIFIGGGLGAVCRYLTAIGLKNYSFNFPVATLSVNIIGSLILGFVAALFWLKSPEAAAHNTAKLAITVGFCGGLTTFSTFSWETFDLIKNGEFLLAGIYTITSVIACILAIGVGVLIAKFV